MALGIVRDRQIAHLQGFGVADSSGRAVTPQTPFYIGSVTKSFTALAVMQLVEAGEIDLDAPVQRYLPSFELADTEASAKITVRNLLNHTTGISTTDGNRFWPSQQGLEETVNSLTTIQLDRPVGTTFEYSNLNYSIAGLIVEKVAGQSYADYVTQHIFAPLDMRHSYASRAPALADGLAGEHYYFVGRAFGFEGPKPPAILPVGFLIASAEDITHYAIAQLNDGRYGTASILSPQGIAALHAPAPTAKWQENYSALGWNVATWDGIPTVWHNGDTGRAHSMAILMPDRGSAVVLLSNASGFVQITQVDQIAKGVVNLLNGKPPSPVSLPFLLQLTYWTILLTPLLQILGIVLVWRSRKRAGIRRVVLTVIANLGVVLLLFGLSQLIPFPLPSLLVFYPELGVGLIAVATLGVGWSVIYTAMSLAARQSTRDGSVVSPV